MCKRIKAKFQRSEGHGENSNVWKNKTRIRKFGRIRSEFQCLEGKGQNSNVWKCKKGIVVVKRIRLEFHVSKDEVRIRMFERIK